MDDAFEKLRRDGNNSVDSLIQWMKEAKLIDEAKASEERARKLFADVADVKDVELAKFKEAVAKLAAEQKRSVEDFTRMLSQEGPKLFEAMVASANTFKETMKKK